jgi:hypothetical protein
MGRYRYGMYCAPPLSHAVGCCARCHLVLYGASYHLVTAPGRTDSCATIRDIIYKFVDQRIENIVHSFGDNSRSTPFIGTI